MPTHSLSQSTRVDCVTYTFVLIESIHWMVSLNKTQSWWRCVLNGKNDQNWDNRHRWSLSSWSVFSVQRLSTDHQFCWRRRTTSVSFRQWSSNTQKWGEFFSRQWKKDSVVFLVSLLLRDSPKDLIENLCHVSINIFTSLSPSDNSKSSEIKRSSQTQHDWFRSLRGVNIVYREGEREDGNAWFVSPSVTHPLSSTKKWHSMKVTHSW